MRWRDDGCVCVRACACLRECVRERECVWTVAAQRTIALWQSIGKAATRGAKLENGFPPTRVEGGRGAITAQHGTVLAGGRVTKTERGARECRAIVAGR